MKKSQRLVELKRSGYTQAVIGIDPGVTTGVAVMATKSSFRSGQVDYRWTRQLSYGGSGNDAQDVHVDGNWPEQQIVELIVGYITAVAECIDDVHIVIEDFIVRQFNASRDFLSPVRITAGILQALFELQLGVQVHVQSPSEAKTTCTDERMDRWGLTISTLKDRHSRDAERHCILFIRKSMAKMLQGNRI